MSKAQERDRHNIIEQDKQAALHALIGEQVLHALGAPTNLLQVQVRSLWQEHYRVNVLVGADIASARVAHSYFLVADSDGNIGTATPRIAKTY